MNLARRGGKPLEPWAYISICQHIASEQVEQDPCFSNGVGQGMGMER